ncbi:MAG: phospholipase A2 [Ilumatobacteraceae bacterium]
MMRAVLSVLVAVTSFLTVSSPASAGSAHTATGDLAYIRRELYSVSITQFTADANSTGDRWFDWSTDWCSAPLVGSTGRSFDFRASCRRHDFGYRNLQLLERRYGAAGRYWNGTSRLQVDRQLLEDMKAHCTARPWYEEATCRLWADTFYAAVRVAGGP